MKTPTALAILFLCLLSLRSICAFDNGGFLRVDEFIEKHMDDWRERLELAEHCQGLETDVRRLRANPLVISFDERIAVYGELLQLSHSL